jgi:hypothetical protein
MLQAAAGSRHTLPTNPLPTWLLLTALQQAVVLLGGMSCLWRLQAQSSSRDSSSSSQRQWWYLRAVLIVSTR